MESLVPVEVIEKKIFLIRGQKLCWIGILLISMMWKREC